jgi:hypothetical protein
MIPRSASACCAGVNFAKQILNRRRDIHQPAKEFLPDS